MDDDHPLLQELASLRNAVAHYQHETHASGLKLQRLSLDSSTAHARLNAIQAENARLQEELAVFRAHPDASPSTNSTAVQELTLALRRLSDKLDATDEALLRRNQELAEARAERDRSKHAADNAFALAARLRAEVEAAHVTQRDLQARVKAAEEERSISDLAVEEYASLVRSMEGRQSGSGGRSSVDGLASARLGLHRLLQESNVDAEKLHGEISHLHGLLEASRASLNAEHQSALESRQNLAQAELELQRVRADDKAAAKMVSRYMKFSQSTIDMLHTTMENLRLRHAATLATSQERVKQADDRLVLERSQSERLRHALDELTEDISREAYGRRREVSLRLALLRREERLSESVRRWTLKARESTRKPNAPCEACSQAISKVIEGADGILRRLEDDQADSIGSEARIIASQSTVASLIADLQRETDRRLSLEHQFAIADGQGIEVGNSPPMKSTVETSMRTATPFSPAPPSSTPSSSTLQSFPSVTSPSESASVLNVNEEEKSSKHVVAFPTVIISEPSVPSIPAEVPYAEHSVEFSTPSPATHEDPRPISSKEGGEQNCSPRTFETSIEEEVIKRADSETPHPSGTESNTEFGPSSTADQKERNSSVAADFSSLAEPLSETAPSVLSGLTEISADENSNDHESDVNGVPCITDESTTAQAIADEEETFGGVSAVVETPHLDSAQQNLLDQLRAIENRYDSLQRMFRDCHVSLEQVTENFDAFEDANLARTLRTAVQRLDDYCEDARVELEIRVADEERIAKGYETLLSVPGAISEEINDGEVYRQIEAFLDGSDPAVRRSLDLLQHKLGDLQHDIAKVKHAMHGSPDASESAVPEQAEKPVSPSGWSAWTKSILSHSRPSSPAPTFGSVITSPRLRHSSSFTQRIPEQGGNDPLENLGLRIAMPSRKPSPPALSSEMHSRPVPRPRVSSTMFSVGIGGGSNGPLGLSSRKPSFGFNFSSPSNPPSPRSALTVSSDRSMDEDVE